MNTEQNRLHDLERELEEIRSKLAEAEATLSAIRQDKVDALVVAGPHGDEIRTILSVGTVADSIFNQVSQPVFILDASNRILRANRLAHALCGEDPEMKVFADALALRLTTPEHGPREGEAVLPSDWITAARPIEALDVALVRPNGETLYFLLDAKPIPVPVEGFRGGIVTMMDITRRKLAEIQIAVRNEQLRYQLRLTRSITDHAADGLILVDAEKRVEFMNPSAARMLGIDEEEISGKRLRDVILFASPDDVAAQGGWPFHDFSSGREVQHHRAALIAKAGTRLVVQCSLSPVVEDDVVTGGVLVMSDVSQQVAAERALFENQERQRQSQKLEAIGRLAGGIAHDFNNLLLAMMGFAELSMAELDEASPVHEYMREIKRAGEKAAAITSQLLAYGRKQVLEPRVGHLESVVDEIRAMLQRIVGASIRLEVELSEEPLLARIDKAQLQRVLVNLAMNAADAMPDGGTLSIRTARRTLASADVSGLMESLRKEGEEGVPAGDYATIEVRDTGHGMVESVKAQLFEPFFTTKKFGKGAGLGLSTVYGIVKQMGGFIQVFSAPGEGSCFRIAFPLAKPALAEAEKGELRAPLRAPSGETVLLAEDEEAVRRLLVTLLSGAGYNVLEAPDGEDALALLSTYEGPLDLLLTDVVMERMGGRELAEKVVALRPGTGVVFISGYAEDQVLGGCGSIEGSVYVPKPFRPAWLLQTIREVLERRSAAASVAQRRAPDAHPPR